MNFHCLVPARGGSQGLPGKNIRRLNNVPLIAHTIITAKESGVFASVSVSTDSLEIADVSKEYGAEVPYIRESSLAESDTHMFKVYRDFVNRVELMPKDILMVMLPTNPLREVSDIINVANRFKEDASLDWVFTCNEMEHHPYRAVRINKENMTLEPFFPIDNNVMWSNRQELPTAYRFNGAIIAGRVGSIRDNSEYPIDSFEHMSTRVGAVLSSEFSRLDIDTKSDFDYIQSLLEG